MASSNEIIDLLTCCVICRKSDLSEREIFVNTESTCRHKFCQSCVLKMDKKFKCPYVYCKSDVLKEKLKPDTDPDKLETDCDNSIRRTYKAIFNKSRNDFSTLEEFSQYQERFETIVYNLVHGIHVEETKKEIEKYKQQNRDIAFKEAQRDANKEEELRQIYEERKQQEESNNRFELKLHKEKQIDEGKRKRANIIALSGENVTANSESETEQREEINQQATTLAEQKDNIVFIPETHPLVDLLRKFLPPQMVNQQPPKLQPNSYAKVHIAGGYDYKTIYHARNLSEILHQLEEINPSIHV